MTTSPLLPLPPDGGATAGSMPAAPRSKPGTWQREMERALEQAWFKHPLILLGQDVASAQLPQERASSPAPVGSAHVAAVGCRAVGAAVPARTTQEACDRTGAAPAAAQASPQLEDAPGDAVAGFQSGAPGTTPGANAAPAAPDAGPAPARASGPVQRLADALPAGTAQADAAACYASACEAPALETALQDGWQPARGWSAVALANGPLPVALMDQLGTRLADWLAPVPATGPASVPDGVGLQPAADTPAEPETESVAAEPSARSTVHPETAPAVEAPEPLRLHAEWSGQGVRIWLGADVQAGGAAPALAPQLVRWLAQQGVALLSLVCNGRTVYAAPGTDVGDGWRADGIVALPRAAGTAYLAAESAAPQALTDQFF